MIKLNSETLDKIDRFRSQSISNIKDLDFPEEVILLLRRRMNLVIDALTEEFSSHHEVPTVIVDETIDSKTQS